MNKYYKKVHVTNTQKRLNQSVIIEGEVQSSGRQNNNDLNGLNQRGGSVDIQSMGGKSLQLDPAKQLVRKMKREKLDRQRVQQERQLVKTQEMKVRSDQEARKFEQLKIRMQEDKLHRMEEKKRQMEGQKLERLKFREVTDKQLRDVLRRKESPLYLEKAKKFDEDQI